MSRVMDVLKIKGTDVVTIEPDATVLAAAARMRDHKIGGLVVLQAEKIIGIITERDLMNRVLAERKDPAQTLVREIMTTRVAFCTLETTIDACRSAMTRNRIRHLPVVENDKLMGIITSGDILARQLHDQEETIHWLHDYIVGPN